MIKVEEIEMQYGSFKALNKVSFKVNKGEVVGLLGPNGAGKSTTMKVLTTYLYPNAGKAYVDGLDVTEKPLEVRARIGYLPELLPLYLDMEVKDYLHFVAQSRAIKKTRLTKRLDWVVEHLELKPVYRKLCRELSKGFRQRVGLAQALIHDPDIVILDEPTSGLDPHQIQEIRALIRNLGKNKTVILSTHILQEAQAVSDRIVIINRGRIVGDGTIEELQRQAHPVERTFVAIIGKKDDIIASLKDIDGGHEVLYLNDVDGYCNFEIRAQQGRQIWKQIGALCKEKGWQLGLLKDIPYSLEDTFMSLTKEENL
ncbi:MAG: ABC transporter ATP-binding protein [Candidatus Magnetoovum sp. WYHC-5]|nr:ABC transporter ATP-binding protein [Candidatus Magnetoovum sp. WYHC-5]